MAGDAAGDWDQGDAHPALKVMSVQNSEVMSRRLALCRPANRGLERGCPLSVQSGFRW